LLPLFILFSVVVHLYLISGVYLSRKDLSSAQDQIFVSVIKKTNYTQDVKAIEPKKIRSKPEIKHIQKMKKDIHKPTPIKMKAVPSPVEQTNTAEEQAKASVIEPNPIPVQTSISAKNEPVTIEVPIPTFDRDSYNRTIRNIIDKNKVYPPIAKRRKIQGSVLISFTILTDGSVSDFNVDKSSGFKQLDVAAHNILKKSVPFPPPPENVNYTLPIKFKI